MNRLGIASQCFRRAAVIEAFVEELDLASLGFDGAMPSTTGHPSYHPAVLPKIYIHGYLNRVQSSRRLERERQRNVELLWLTGRLAPDFKTIADFRRDNGVGIRNVFHRFVMLCREVKLFSQARVAIDGSKSRQSIRGIATSPRVKSTSARSRSRRASSAYDERGDLKYGGVTVYKVTNGKWAALQTVGTR
jgi:transposase